MMARPAGFGPIAGIVLAGGLSRRMGGGDKCLRTLGKRPILSHVLGRFAPQVDRLAINANGDPARFAGFGLEVVADSIEGFAGPLAGVLAGLDWARSRFAEATHLASVPADGPFLPRDLVERLIGVTVEHGRPLATAASGGRTHPVVGLWPLALRDDLRAAIVRDGVRKVDLWTARHGVAVAEFTIEDGIDPFFNANDPGELAEAERLASALVARG